ncbi:MAG: hypothetical protein IKO93_05675 [Lentisphaeria bacterium]|nr:hypothetical protein [Lentisphaeria bacterium]
MVIVVTLPCGIAWRPAESITFELLTNFCIRFAIEKDLNSIHRDIIHDFAAFKGEFRQNSGFFRLGNCLNDFLDPFPDTVDFLIVVGKLPAWESGLFPAFFRGDQFSDAVRCQMIPFLNEFGFFLSRNFIVADDDVDCFHHLLQFGEVLEFFFEALQCVAVGEIDRHDRFLLFAFARLTGTVLVPDCRRGHSVRRADKTEIYLLSGWKRGMDDFSFQWKFLISRRK